MSDKAAPGIRHERRLTGDRWFVCHRYETPRGPRLLLGIYGSARAARWAIVRAMPRGKGRIVARIAVRKETCDA